MRPNFARRIWQAYSFYSSSSVGQSTSVSREACPSNLRVPNSRVWVTTYFSQFFRFCFPARASKIQRFRNASGTSGTMRLNSQICTLDYHAHKVRSIGIPHSASITAAAGSSRFGKMLAICALESVSFSSNPLLRDLIAADVRFKNLR